MKTLATYGLAALLSLSVAAQASAYSLHPRNTNFRASGKTNLTKGSLVVPCTSTFVGNVDSAGVGHIKSAFFTGSSLCTAIKATHLPWIAKARSATAGTVYSVSVTASIFGTCGPSNVTGTVSKTGVFTFNNQTLTPNCKVNGSVATTPKITIVSP